MAAKNHVTRVQMEAINALIAENPADTADRVKAALRYLSITAGASIGVPANEEEAYGFSLLLDTCANALDSMSASAD